MLNDGIQLELGKHKSPEIKDFVRKFNFRDHYKFIGELNLPRNTKKKFSNAEIEQMKVDIVGYQKDDGNKEEALTVSDLCLDPLSIVYVPKDHYSAINLYDERNKLSSIEKFNYLEF